MKTNSVSASLINRLTLKKDSARPYRYKNPMTKSRPFRGGTPFQAGKHAGYPSTWGFWSEHCDEHARFVGLAQSIVKLGHTGWYTMGDCTDELARGVVYLLPHGRYLAAMADPCQSHKDGTGPCVIECKPNGQPYIYDDKEDAARAADSLAEVYAEGECEYQRQESERVALEEKIEECKGTLDELRSDARGLVDGIRESTLSPSLCERLRAELKSMRASMHREYHDMRQAVKELSELPASV